MINLKRCVLLSDKLIPSQTDETVAYILKISKQLEHSWLGPVSFDSSFKFAKLCVLYFSHDILYLTVAVRPQGVTSPFKKSLVPGSSGMPGSAGPGGPSGRWMGPSSRVDSLPEHEVTRVACLPGIKYFA